MAGDVDQLDALRGVDSLQVVFHRFSDGVEVVKCVLEFCKEVGDVEQDYSNSIQKLLRSSSYSFHSNILMRWLGSDPYKEIGTVRKSWQKLGTELTKLADLHSQKATAYLEAVRQPLLELLPRLEETRQELKNKIHTLRTDLETASQKHTKEKQKYIQLGDNCQKLKEKSDAKGKQKLLVMDSELKLQEAIYREAHTRLVDAHTHFDEEVKALYQKVQDKELERVNMLKTSLQQFTKTMSNTAPAYLEGFQRIVMSVDEISGQDDIRHFVGDHQDLVTEPNLPEFERHPYLTGEAVTEFSEPLTSSSTGPIASASLVAKKFLSKLHLRDNKPSASEENSETSAEGERNASVSPPPVDSNEEESNPVISKRSSHDARGLDEVRGDMSISKSLVGGTSSRHDQKRSDALDGGQKSGTTSAGVSTKPSLLFERKSKERVDRSRKPNVKPKTQSPSSPTVPQQQLVNGEGKTKMENGSLERSNTRPSDIKSEPPKPAAIRTRNTPQARVPGPVKPRPTERAVPSSSFSSTYPSPHPPGSRPRPLSSPNAEESASASGGAELAAGGGSKEERQLLTELRQKATANDYYSLLGVDSEASVEELARGRRDKTRVLHPDHFANDPERQAKAQEQLALINQVFQDVLKNEETRRHYDQLCRFRQFYGKILHQKVTALENALGKLVSLHKSMKRSQMPLALLDEVLLVQKVIRTRIKILSTSSPS